MNSPEDRECPEYNRECVDHEPSSSVRIDGNDDETAALLSSGISPVSIRTCHVSKERRTFCLFTFFNCIFIVMLWLIMVSIKSSQIGFSYPEVVLEEMLQTDVSKTSFDIIWLAIFRASMLLLAYATCKCKSRFPVASTTCITSGYAVFKILYTDYSGENSYKSVAIMMPITTFVVAWIEALFMDYRVLPKEQRATKTVQNQHNPHVRQYQFSRGEQEDDFHSLSEFVDGIDEGDYDVDLDLEDINHLSSEEYQYVQQGIDAMQNVISMLGMETVWNKEKSRDDGDVYTLNGPNNMKIFILKMSLPCPPEVVYKEVILQPERMPSWNRAVIDCQVLMRISDHTLVTYDVSAGAANGYVKPRDFVNVRRIEKQGQRYISAGMSTLHENKPPSSDFVRGNNDSGGFIVQKNSEQHNGCSFIWILNTDIKGNIPRYLVNKSLAEIMFAFASSLRQHLKDTHTQHRSSSSEVPRHSRP
uniref:StAR-related lipid transfer protein 3-like n=1 Tax=Petromyzon marinus TaxID=7757 RepID=A0AAJ7SMV7_PETMA|nr:stAR-related lipid transfer protein 3-like [Petromyzon marinus]